MAALPRKWVSDGAPTLVSSIYAIFCSLSADAFSDQKRPAAAASSSGSAPEDRYDPCALSRSP
jgi:hypothetical protein